MSIATEITRLQTAKADLKTALEAKGATIPSETTLDGYPDIVDDIPVALLQDKDVSVSGGTTVIEPDSGYTGMHSVTVTASGGGPVEEKTVNFIDYEGTIVASYTGVEAQALTALPDAPDHTLDTPSLTFDEWNWTLAEIKSYNTSYPEAVIWVGATYHTTDGNNHFYFYVTNNRDGNGVAMTLQGYSSGDTVDWGDGSATETISSATLTHVYTTAGEFHCVVDSTATSYAFSGASTTKAAYRGKLIKAYLSKAVTGSLPYYGFGQCSSLQVVMLPNSVTGAAASVFDTCRSLKSLTIPRSLTKISDSMLKGCSSLSSVSIPHGVTYFYSSAFSDCSSLQSLTIPDGVTGYSSSAFYACYSLKSLTIPSGVTIGSSSCSGCNSLRSVSIASGATSIPSSMLLDCYSLQTVTIPSSVTSIGSNAFNNCYSLYSVSVLATEPPTLSNTNSFNATYLKKIYVPSGSVADYKAATNWDTFASIIEAIPS